MRSGHPGRERRRVFRAGRADSAHREPGEAGAAGRAEAEERAAKAEAQLREQAPLVEQLQKEVNALRAERDHVRQRVERLLAQLDALEL